MTTISGDAGAGGAVGRYYGQLMGSQVQVVVEIDPDPIGDVVGAYYESAAGAFWMGETAARLGLEGAPTVAQIARLVDGVDTAGVVLGRKFGGTSARAFDATFSVQKEVSILWAAADPETREVIEQAVVDAAVAVLEDQVGARAATRMRTGPNGDFLAADKKPVMVDAEGPAVAVIPEFTSRKGDPQLHVHGLVSSKVWEPTTQRFLALDARELKQDQRAMSAMFHAGLEAELSSKLGVTWGARAYTYARTINGINNDLIDVFSQRRTDVDARLDKKLARFETELGHAPTPQQRWKLEREAAVDSRPGKSTEVLDFDSWHETITTHTGQTPTELVAAVTGNQDLTHTISQASRDDMVQAALGELSDARSSWTRGDLKTELARVLPPNLAVTPTELVRFVNTQTDQVLDSLLEVTPPTVDRPIKRWTTPEVLTQETRILEHADTATNIEISPNPTVAAHAPEWLDAMQLAAAARVASDSGFELVVGLAGTGKTSMLKTATDTLTAEGRGVFGLGPSAVAAQVLGDETGMATDNVSKFLWEHNQRNSGPSDKFRLPPGATLIVDEAGMVSTPHWAALTNLASQHDWRLVAVGDGYQFSAVGRGGIFEHLTNTMPTHRISRLEQVHRFDAPWEAAASAALRQGDTAALDVYEQHGRIIATGPDRTLEDVVVDLYLDRHQTGIDTGIFAATNQQVDQLNHAIQQALIDTGKLGRPLLENTDSPTVFYAGDIIETRKNNRDLVTDRNLFVKNRDRWTIESADDNGLVVTGSQGTVTLPHNYVADHVNLAYAQTSHASQGRTITGTSILAYNPEMSPTDRAGLYVPMTRGTQENLVIVEADNIPIAKAHLGDAIERRWIDTPAITHLHQQHEPVPLAEQTTAAKQSLEYYEQQNLFDPAPAPPVNPAAPTRAAPTPPSLVEAEPPAPTPGPATEQVREEVWARRSEAEVRQHPEPTPVGSVAVLSADELMNNLMVVDELAWPVDNAPAEIDRIKIGQAGTREKYNEMLSAFRDLADKRDEHAANPPLLRGIKTWETTLAQYDRSLERSRSTLDGLKDHLEDLQNDRTHWAQYETLATQTKLGNARNTIINDRQHRGTRQLDNPDLTSRLGAPPTEPDALTVWKNAAGAIDQHNTITENFDMPRHHQISARLNSVTRMGIKALGQHVGTEHIPELQPVTRHIEGPSLGR